MSESDFVPKLDFPVFFKNSTNGKVSKSRALTTAIGLVLLIVGIVAGALLVTQRQLFDQKAGSGLAYCGDGVCNENAASCPRDCGSNIINCGGVQCQAQYCHCTGGQACTGFECVNEEWVQNVCTSQGRSWCSNSEAGGGMTCCAAGYVCNPSGEGCVPGTNRSEPPSSGTPAPTPRVTPTPTSTPRVTPTPTPTPTPSHSPTATPTPTPVAMCQRIEIYSPGWTQISNSTFSTLRSGAQVYFCVGGFTNSTSPFDKARFKVNGVTRQETTLRRPGTSDFCDLYTIPQSTYNFRVVGELHHPTLGWR